MAAAVFAIMFVLWRTFPDVVVKNQVQRIAAGTWTPGKDPKTGAEIQASVYPNDAAKLLSVGNQLLAVRSDKGAMPFRKTPTTAPLSGFRWEAGRPCPLASSTWTRSSGAPAFLPPFKERRIWFLVPTMPLARRRPIRGVLPNDVNHMNLGKLRRDLIAPFCGVKMGKLPRHLYTEIGPKQAVEKMIDVKMIDI